MTKFSFVIFFFICLILPAPSWAKNSGSKVIRVNALDWFIAKFHENRVGLWIGNDTGCTFAMSRWKDDILLGFVACSKTSTESKKRKFLSYFIDQLDKELKSAGLNDIKIHFKEVNSSEIIDWLKRK